MEGELLIAIIAALLNILFSILIPPLFSNNKLPFGHEIKNHYDCNKQFILVSSILTIILVYISLKITPFINVRLLGNISELNKIYEITNPVLPSMQPVVPSMQPVVQSNQNIPNQQFISNQNIPNQQLIR